jgi:hypothetical protein
VLVEPDVAARVAGKVALVARVPVSRAAVVVTVVGLVVTDVGVAGSPRDPSGEGLVDGAVPEAAVVRGTARLGPVWAPSWFPEIAYLASSTPIRPTSDAITTVTTITRGTIRSRVPRRGGGSTRRAGMGVTLPVALRSENESLV